jgi:hypothetical protein
MRWLVGLLAIALVAAPVLAQDAGSGDAVGGEETELISLDDEQPAEEESLPPTPIIVVATATPQPSPIVIVVTATPELTAVTADPSPMPAATSAPEPRPSRADTVQGQTGTFCKNSTRFSLRVVSTSEVRVDIIGMIVEAANLGNRSEDIFRSFDLRDQRGRSFDMTGSSEYPQYFDDLRPLRAEGVISDTTNIQPGRTEMVYAAFLVAPDSTTFRLVQRRPPCA